jgi:hypothetical protein
MRHPATSEPSVSGARSARASGVAGSRRMSSRTGERSPRTPGFGRRETKKPTWSMASTASPTMSHRVVGDCRRWASVGSSAMTGCGIGTTHAPGLGA